MPVTTASGNSAGTLTGSLAEAVGEGWPAGLPLAGVSPAVLGPDDEGTGVGFRLTQAASIDSRTTSEAARLTAEMRTALS
jgi:hypothetical protein